MNIKINQRGGFGDIFFTQKIGKRLIELGHTVYWPIVEEYEKYVNEYMVGDINWCEPAISDFVVLDIGNASWLVGWENKTDIYDKVMESKYVYANKHFDIGDWIDWPEYLQIKRNYVKEEKLCSMLIKNREFAVVNRHFATEHIPLDMKISSDLPEIEIQKIPGFTLFDWCGILERATEIRIPDSSFPYLVEILNTTDKLFMYKRNQEPCIRTKPIWKKNWRFME